MTTHTPGPWEIRPTSKKGNGTGWRDIVSMSGPFTPSYIGEALDINANLIAAAPDLLAALEALLYRTRDDAQTMALNALAKATGQSVEVES